MRDHAIKVETDMDLFEIVGTGGDNAGSFNISTTAALVAAAGGVKWQTRKQSGFFQVRNSGLFRGAGS